MVCEVYDGGPVQRFGSERKSKLVRDVAEHHAESYLCKTEEKNIADVPHMNHYNSLDKCIILYLQSTRIEFISIR